MEPITWDYILKYVIVGDAAVGKSSILVRLTDDRFASTEPTLGVEFGSRILTVGERGKKVKVQCWDTAGTESFRSITRSYFRGAAGALLVYDVTRRDSFEHVTSWLEDLREYADDNVTIILVANKTDLCTLVPPQASAETQQPQAPSTSTSPNPFTTGTGRKVSMRVRAVSTAEGSTFAKLNGLLYVETSAKEGWGVVEAFETSAREVLRRLSEEELRRRKPPGVKVGADAKAQGGCC